MYFIQKTLWWVSFHIHLTWVSFHIHLTSNPLRVLVCLCHRRCVRYVSIYCIQKALLCVSFTDTYHPILSVCVFVSQKNPLRVCVCFTKGVCGMWACIAYIAHFYGSLFTYTQHPILSVRVRMREKVCTLCAHVSHTLSDEAWWRQAHEQGLPSCVTGSPRTRSDHERDSLV